MSKIRFSIAGFFHRRHRIDWGFLVILVVALAAHSLLLLNDWEYWDGPTVHRAAEARNLLGELRHYGMNGVPIYGIYIWVMGLVPTITFNFRLAAFLAYFLSAVFTYRIGVVSGLASRLESVSIATVALVYPVFQVAMINDISGYLVGNCIFIAAALLAVLAEQQRGQTHWRYRAFAWALFFLAFNFNNANYVYYFGFMFFWMFYVLRQHDLSLGEFFRRFVWRRADYLILPFLAWGIRAVFYPVSGGYAETGYNAFILDPESLQLWAGRYLNLAIVDPYAAMIARHRWYLAGVFVLCLALLLWRRGWLDRLAGALQPHPRYWALVGLVLAVAAVVPYVLVGKGPTKSIFAAVPFDPDTRHTLLLGLPLAILIVGLLRTLVMSRKAALAAAGLALLVVVVAESIVVHIENYVDWQIRSVKDRSLIAQLQDNPEADLYSILWVDDQFPAGGYRFEENRAFYVYSEWHYIADHIWPEYGHTLIDGGYFGTDPGAHYWHYETNWAGCQGWLYLRRNPAARSDRYILAHYYFYLFFDPGRLERYLGESPQRATLFEITPVDAPEAVDCLLPAAE